MISPFIFKNKNSIQKLIFQSPFESVDFNLDVLSELFHLDCRAGVWIGDGNKKREGGGETDVKRAVHQHTQLWGLEEL